MRSTIPSRFDLVKLFVQNKVTSMNHALTENGLYSKPVNMSPISELKDSRGKCQMGLEEMTATNRDQGQILFVSIVVLHILTEP